MNADQTQVSTKFDTAYDQQLEDIERKIEAFDSQVCAAGSLCSLERNFIIDEIIIVCLKIRFGFITINIMFMLH